MSFSSTNPISRSYCVVPVHGKFLLFLFPFLLLGLCLFIAMPAEAAVKTMHIEWDYDTTLPGLAGYRIYQDGVMIHQVTDPTILTADITVTFTGDSNFTMTAFDTDGIESAHSDPYLVAYSDINTPPQATDIAFSVNEDTSLSDTLTASDPDNDTLSFTVISQPQHGTLTVTDPATGAFSYTPAADYAGTDSFIFKVSDGVAESAPATASLTITPVNDTPVTAAAALTTDEDTPLTGNLTATDADNDTLTFSVINGPASGSLTINPADGSFTYTPNADFSGSDSFTFTSSDGQVEAGPATITITVNEINDPPVARVDNTGKAAAGSQVTLDGSRSTDPDDGIASVTWKQVSGPAVQLDTDTSLTPSFTAPASGPRGTPLAFELTVTDKSGLTSTASASVLVNWPLPSPAIRTLAAMR